jgi:hypothetical protein
MSSKTEKPVKTDTPKYPRKTVFCKSGPSVDEQGRSYAKLITSAEFAAHRVVALMQPSKIAEDIDIPTLVEILREQAAAAQSGDLAHTEAMLMNQASALQSVFVRLSERAMEQSQMPNLEGFMRLALRAQSQCRTTLEALAAIKNPPIIYARQANVTTGPQQINNGAEPLLHAREIESAQNQLSGEEHELRTHSRAQSETSRVDPALEALGEIYWAENRRG